jgi:membrane protease YdiL (CAAX protease family)
MRHWAALLSIAGALVVFGFLMLPMSFNIVVGHEEGQTVREVVYTMSCAAAAYLSLAGIVTGYFLRRTGQGARQRNL